MRPVLEREIRVVRPVSVSETEVTIYCFAPKERTRRNARSASRQYEDFFDVSAAGTPDDLENSVRVRQPMSAPANSGMTSAGVRSLAINGPDENAKAIDLKPLLSGERSEDEESVRTPA